MSKLETTMATRADDSGTSQSAKVVNVTRLIDEGPVTRFQIGIIICCALVNLFDGADTQSIGVAAPMIADGLGIKISSFGPIFAAALVGATLGAASFGPIADRFGRKNAFDRRHRADRRVHYS